MQCQALRNVPRLKLDMALSDLENEKDNKLKSIKKKALHRYFEANIPVKYWNLEMTRDFTGDRSLLEYYNRLTNDITESYKKGIAVCFSGNFGCGKSFLVTNVLKRSIEKGYSGLFVNLNDIISSMKSGEQFQARRELLKVDFLVIDEFDPRYMANQASSDFYGRVLEDVLRNRTQNRLPILMCTNSPNPNLSFEGILQQSISSLFNYVDLVPSLGEDYRPKEGKHE
jgi:DNA replication protein DnaC